MAADIAAKDVFEYLPPNNLDKVDFTFTATEF